MFPSRLMQAKIEQLGSTASVLERTASGTTNFGNPTSDYNPTRTVVCLRTYPDHNSEIRGVAGDRIRDVPIFLFPLGEQPPEEARLDYPEADGSVTEYELKAATNYPTHVEMTGQRVDNA